MRNKTMMFDKSFLGIQNSQTGEVKIVDKNEWLGHYQFDDNWTIFKEIRVGC